MTIASWTIGPLIVVASGQTRSIPGWHLPVTIEVMRDVEMKSSAIATHEERGILYTWTRLPAQSLAIKSGERFQMVKVSDEGECRIRFKNRNYDLSSYPWLPGFHDPEADIYRVVSAPVTRGSE